MKAPILFALLALAGCQKGEENIRKAHVFFKSGDIESAAELYRAAAHADPNNAAAWEGLGNVAFEKRSYDEAIDQYKKAIAIDAKAMSARHKLAVALTTANRAPEAIEVLVDTVGLDPTNAFALNALGGLHQKQGDLDEAKRYQISALAADDDFHAARFALGSLLVDMGELEEAEREFSRLMVREQGSLAEYGFARLAARRGKWDRAAQHLSNVLDGAVSHPERIAKDPVFADGWSTPPMRAAKEKLDRAAGTKTSTMPLR
jgi:tetratricopeptide (TPR) repeat protein